MALLAAAAAGALPAALAAQTQGEADDLAQLLSLTDRREFDLAALRREAQHPDSLIRAQAAVAIGRIGDRAGTPLLLMLLADPDTTVRAQAAFALGLLRDTAAAGELARRLDQVPAVATGPDQVELVTALAKTGGRAAAAALDALLQRHPPGGATDDPATAQALLEAWRLGPLAPAGRLADYVRSGSGVWRRNATYSLARLAALGQLADYSGAAAALLGVTGAADPLTRSYAARALTASVADSAHLSHDGFESQLRTLVADTAAGVRILALRSLASFRDSSLAVVAQPLLVDPDPNAQIQALTTLGALGGHEAVGSLEARFTEATASFAARRAALLALGEAAPAQALADGAKWRSDPDWRLRAVYAEAAGAAAARGAGPVRDSVVAILNAMSADADPRVEEAALAALSEATPRGAAAARAIARARLASGDVFVRTAALDLLDRERDPALIPDLVAAYRAAARDVESDARLAAVRALADIAAGDGVAAARVEQQFVAAVPRSPDYLVRRAVADEFGWDKEARYWGGVYPIETRRSLQDYRDVAATLLLPALQSGALPKVSIETDRGTLQLALYAGDAPLTVQNFLTLADRRYFDGSRWHRVVPNFVIQDGDPRGDGNGGPGWAIRDEINPRPYVRGTVGMALSGADTGGSQFFICHSPQPHLDGAYTVFGQVIEGDDVLEQIVQGDRIRRIARQQ